MNNLTLLIHYHKESEERERNLRATSRWLQREFPGIRISVFADACEVADDLRPLVTIEDDSRVQGIYHRTKAFNELCKRAETDYVGIWDTDVVFYQGQILDAMRVLQEGRADFVWPYSGNFWRMKERPSDDFYNHLDAWRFAKGGHSSLANSVGGAILVNRSAYAKIGGENENFIGYGAEDVERAYRMQMLGRTLRIPGDLYHMYHPMTPLSQEGHTHAIANNIAVRRIQAMLAAELEAEIKTWSWYYG